MSRLLILCIFLLLLLVVVLSACQERGYYAQAVKGHMQLMLQRRPIDDVIAASGTPQKLTDKLLLVRQIRNFASRELHLPDNASYRSYVDLGRPYAVWNVVAVPEFSLEPLNWCFPVAGCVSYRGYYLQSDAEKFAAGLAAAGYDTDLYGVSAYSTLGWFSDPVLNTFLDRPEPALAGLIFHELAHQQLYVRDDTSFNEGFAEVVEEEGVKRWLESKQENASLARTEDTERRKEEFIQLLLKTRQELAALYASTTANAKMREEKERILAALPLRYRQWRDERWPGYTGFDHWFDRPVNNARLAAIATYVDDKPALRSLLQHCSGDLTLFYREARLLAELPRAERRLRMTELAARNEG